MYEVDTRVTTLTPTVIVLCMKLIQWLQHWLRLLYSYVWSWYKSYSTDSDCYILMYEVDTRVTTLTLTVIFLCMKLIQGLQHYVWSWYNGYNTDSDCYILMYEIDAIVTTLTPTVIYLCMKLIPQNWLSL